MKTSTAVTLSSLVLLASPVSVESSRAEPPVVAPGPAAPSAYAVAPGDVIEVTVEGRPDLSRLPTVQTSGTVRLPRAGEVEVAGLTVEQIAQRLAPLLAAGDLPAPRVSVRVKETQGQFVWVRGAVNRPGRKPLQVGGRLIDALLDAGGFASGASGEVSVERTAGGFEDGSRVHRSRFSGTNPTAQEIEQLALPLVSGDLVTALQQEWVGVDGAVRKPGRYPCDASLTLSHAIANAGGLLRTGDPRVVVRRSAGSGAGEIRADLDAIREGRAEDPPLRPGDVVSVRQRRR